MPAQRPVLIRQPVLELLQRALNDLSNGHRHLSAFAIHGHGLSAELDDIYGVSGNVAPRDVRLFEAWIEQALPPIVLGPNSKSVG